MTDIPASSTAASLPAPGAAAALRALTDAVRRLAEAHDTDDVQAVVCAAARRLTGADGATLVLRQDGQCVYAGEEAIAPLLGSGRRVALSSCISGWAMLHRKPAAIEDVYADARVGPEAFRPTFVRSLVVVPIRTLDPVGAIGIYRARRHVASDQEIGLLQALADSAALALAHVRMAARSELAARDGARRPGQAQRSAGEPVAPPHIDPLTGLPDRRHWDRALAAALSPGEQPVCVALMSVDAGSGDLTAGAGDDLLRRSAATWRARLRPGDLLARYGGEEFAVLLTRCDPSAAGAIAERLRAGAAGGLTVSIGFAQWDGDEVAGNLVCRADEALYQAKREGREGVAFAS